MEGEINISRVQTGRSKSSEILFVTQGQKIQHVQCY